MPITDQITAELGANWRIQFMQPDGLPLNMAAFEVIDFGAIGFKEIFQNVKTILATPLYSAALERTLGLDQTIVDLPINEANLKVIAILHAITQWEPRCEVMNIDFAADPLAGHMQPIIQLKINNVIYGTDTPYTVANIFTAPAQVQQGLPVFSPVAGAPGPPGATGEPGTRGSLWFSGTTAPAAGVAMKPIIVSGQPVQGPQGPQGKQGERGFVWLQGAGDPVTPQKYDMYLNTSNGDVWQFDGATWRRTR